MVRPMSSEGLKGYAGTYSPPAPVRTHRRNRSLHTTLNLLDVPQEIFRRTLGNLEHINTKPALKRFLLSNTLPDLCTLIQNRNYTAEDFTLKSTDWMISWISKDIELPIGQASAVALASLAFPEEQIAGLRDKIFQEAAIKSIIQVAVTNHILLANYIDRSDLHLKEKIGSGSGGQVISAVYQNQPVAVKFFKKEGLWFGSEKEFYYEATIISLFGSFKNFIVCHGVNFKEGFIVMPVANNSSLDHLLENNIMKEWNWDMKLRVVVQIASAMRTLHRYDIIHRDLKPANILLDEDYNCYLADFGISRSPPSRKRSMTMNVGTNSYMAPEVLEGNGVYGETIDVYSFGMILWQIANDCSHPYLDQGIGLRDIPAFVTSGSRLEIPCNVPSFIKDLILQCWDQNPKKRPSFAKILASLRKVQF